MEIEPDNNNQSNNESNLPKNSSNIQINKEEIQKKLKQDTINLFNQINIGCKRNFCYNEKNEWEGRKDAHRKARRKTDQRGAACLRKDGGGGVRQRPRLRLRGQGRRAPKKVHLSLHDGAAQHLQRRGLFLYRRRGAGHLRLEKGAQRVYRRGLLKMPGLALALHPFPEHPQGARGVFEARRARLRRQNVDHLARLRRSRAPGAGDRHRPHQEEHGGSLKARLYLRPRGAGRPQRRLLRAPRLQNDL